MYPQVLDLNNNLIAILDKAHKIGYTKIKNNLWTCQFTMPLNDKKNEHINPKFHIDLYDHDRRIGRFIVNPKRTFKTESTNEITYHCEHVLSLLHSDVLFGYHQWSNYTTKPVLTDLMAEQEIKHWKLGEVAFTRYFHYAWENEDSLLNAIMSVPKPFDVPYLWTWDDSTYPFILNLIEPSYTPVDVIASGHNLKGIEIEEDPTNIVTRIYPLGSGEGVNQLNIKKVNNGIPYLQNDVAVAEYNIHKRVWVDMRFEDAESLKASAQAILDKFSKPLRSIAIDCRDYTLYERERKKKLMALYDVGDVLKVHDQDTNTNEEIRLEKIVKGDIYGAPQDIQLELGNVFDDISTTFTDLKKKQLVNETYSQGATNIDSRDFADNCDPDFPAIMRFYIPDDVVNVNEMTLTFEIQKYRAYSKAIEGGGARVVSATSEAGGSVASTTRSSAAGGSVASTVRSSASGGSSTPTSSSGGGGTQTSGQANGWDVSLIPYISDNALPNGSSHRHVVTVDMADFGHWHTVAVPSHSHTVQIASHSHDYTIPAVAAHSHDYTIPAVAAHSHKTEFEMPDHVHDIEHGIFEYSSLPTAVQIYVDGNALPMAGTSGERIDLVPYLKKDSDGKISRGRYAEIKIAPNNLARINANVSSRLFIQSRVGTVL